MTPEAIDKYGAPFFKGFGECQVSNIRTTSGGMTGDLAYTGHHVGKGTVTIAWNDANHAKGTTTYSGEDVQPGQSKSVTWDAHYTAAYLGPDCGKVRPYLR